MRKLAALLPGMALLVIFSCTKPSPHPSNSFPSPGDVPVAVAVDLSKQGIQIPADFTGLSFETQALLNAPSYFSNPTFVNLVKGLGHGVLRVGGASVDQVHWVDSRHPLDSMTITTVDVRNFFLFAGATGWPVIFGLNLAKADPDLDHAESNYILSDFYNQLACFELGNEPDLYSVNGLRPSWYNYESFKYDWTSRYLALTLGGPSVHYAGPATSSNTWVVAFARDRGQFLSSLTEHYYKMGTGVDTVESISRLLDGNTDVLNRVGVLAATSAAYYHMPYRINECNSVAGAKNGVGNSFASALWGLDLMFALAEKGVAGVNFHGGNAPSTPIVFLGPQIKANPLYYGMLFFSKASAGKMLTVKSVPQSSVNLASYAVQQADGSVQVTLINKDLSKEAFVALSAINGNAVFQKASAMRLKGPSASATTGVLLGGSAVKDDGSWSATQSENLLIAANACTVKVPPYSAVLVTLQSGGMATAAK